MALSAGTKHGPHVLDLAGGLPGPATPEGISLTDGVHTTSPDGEFVAATGPDDKGWFYPLEGASGVEPRRIPGLACAPTRLL